MDLARCITVLAIRSLFDVDDRFDGKLALVQDDGAGAYPYSVPSKGDGQGIGSMAFGRRLGNGAGDGRYGDIFAVYGKDNGNGRGWGWISAQQQP